MVEVLEHAPSELGMAERLLLVALAEKARDDTREVIWARSSKPRDVLCRRLGVRPTGLDDIFRRLAKREVDGVVGALDPRVPIGTDKRGTAVFAHEGRMCDYRIPVLDRDLLGGPVEPHTPGVCRGSTAPVSTGGHPVDTGALEPESPGDHRPQVPPPLREEDPRAKAATRFHSIDETLTADQVQRALSAIGEVKTDLDRYTRGFTAADVRRLLGAKRGKRPGRGRSSGGDIDWNAAMSRAAARDAANGVLCPNRSPYAVDGTCCGSIHSEVAS